MSNREIEDVLSSIRRLVTQGDAAPAQAGKGKLVLTPAFRVAEPQPQPVEAEPSAPAPAFSLEQTIAELEAAIASFGGPFEPDEGDATAPDTDAQAQPAFVSVRDAPVAPAPTAAEPNTTAPDAEATAQPALASVREAPVNPAPIAAEATTTAPAPEAEDQPVLGEDDGEDMVFDEAMLRELVTDILREELQGALGQRITRNVRKLVRSEIARALATRDLG
jgi:hypothetical protein